jgi:hypothetical protein
VCVSELVPETLGETLIAGMRFRHTKSLQAASAARASRMRRFRDGAHWHCWLGPREAHGP